MPTEINRVSLDIHRTGMVTCGLLRYRGIEMKEVIGILKDLEVINAANAHEKYNSYTDYLKTGPLLQVIFT